jgi:WD40 repeat protein
MELTTAAGGQQERTLWVSDVESGETRHFALPVSRGSQAPQGESPETRKAWEGGIAHLAFADESTLYTVGAGGLRRWNLETGTHELVAAPPAGSGFVASFSNEARTALLTRTRQGEDLRCEEVAVHDTRAGTSRPAPSWATCGAVQVVRAAGIGGASAVIDATGQVAAFTSPDGSVRVGRLDAAAPHLLAGHKGPIQYLAISPDLRWVATAGEDNTLRLWPMPDLSKPPLHALPLDQLLAKLRSLTNFRAVRDSASSTGWTIEVGPFPGWKSVPEW